MPGISVRLLGSFQLTVNQHQPLLIDSLKTRELFCYLVLNRDRPHEREVLAGTLWGDLPGSVARKHLRQALWHLQVAFGAVAGTSESSMFRVTDGVIILLSTPSLWLDVADVEQAFVMTKGVEPADFTPTIIDRARRAVDLYEGDLLEGWYNDWCLYHRDWLHSMYMSLLDKLMIVAELDRTYDAGIDYGLRALRYEPAHELTHRRLMRLYSLCGDRTQALRQYDRCVALLAEELQIRPARATTTLYERIKADVVLDSLSSDGAADVLMTDIVGRIEAIQDALADLHLHLNAN
jgi:DNA-binding SARP family transcriptional activator